MTSVGVFDSDQDGLNRQITFELWTGGSGNVGGRTRLLQQIFSTGNTGTLNGAHRFLDVPTSLTLLAGQSYTVVAFGYGATEQNYNENMSSSEPQVQFSSAGLTAGVGGWSHGAGAHPDSFNWANPLFSNGGDNFGVATFQYNVVAPIPEPASITLCGVLGLCAAAVVVRRRRRQAS